MSARTVLSSSHIRLKLDLDFITSKTTFSTSRLFPNYPLVKGLPQYFLHRASDNNVKHAPIYPDQEITFGTIQQFKSLVQYYFSIRGRGRTAKRTAREICQGREFPTTWNEQEEPRRRRRIEEANLPRWSKWSRYTRRSGLRSILSRSKMHLQNHRVTYHCCRSGISNLKDV